VKGSKVESENKKQKMFKVVPLNTEKKIDLEKIDFRIDLFEKKALFDPKMNWFLPKIDTTRTFFCERMT